MVHKIFSVNKTYSLTMAHIKKVIEISLASGQSQGEVVREAIDLLYSKKIFLKEAEDTSWQSFGETREEV